MISNPEITVVLNVYRRTDYLNHQINKIYEQTIKPKDLFIWVNKHEDNDGFDFSEHEKRGWKIFKNSYNWKYHGRFAAAQLARTKYVCVFDDDTIPGNRWFENCIETVEKFNCIAGTAGVILTEKAYFPHQRIGWPSKNEEAKEVDLVGHSWFFKKEWLKYMWAEEPYSWENCEDTQFSALAKKYGNIRTFCPPHPESQKELWGSTMGFELGADKVSSWNTENDQWRLQRNTIVSYYINQGWQTVNNFSKDNK